MTPKHLLILFLALFATSLAQSEDDLHIPVENDNQFPPENHSEDGLPVEGSGAGVIEEPLETLETTANILESEAPIIEDVQSSSTLLNNAIVSNAAEHSCPSSCVCNIEGNSNNYVVDCSGADLTELPKPLDAKTTELNLQNNKLTEIPKDISELKSLQVLNVNNNQIMDIVAGSISELPELTSLKLGNNRLIEYPTDLKNSFGLVKLQELDLGGNDMRTALKSETFSNFKALRTLTLPTAAANLVEDVCAALKETLVRVCTESCESKSFDCPEAPASIDDDLLDFALPGFIALGTAFEDNDDPSVSNAADAKVETENQEADQTPPAPSVDGVPSNDSTASSASDISFRAAVIKASGEESKLLEAEPTENASTGPINKAEGEIVGATTSSTTTGGVDKSVIGIIVAGMVLVVAGITIKKNWSSIRNRFSSSPRSANERPGVNANGAAAEEVPLQEKSPV